MENPDISRRTLPKTSVTTVGGLTTLRMSLSEALSRDNLLCYEMNGQTLPALHGFPLRLIAPGRYGVANVKRLTRIEVTDHRHAARFMARDYVSIREQERDGQTVWAFNTDGRLKACPALRTRSALLAAASGDRKRCRWSSSYR